MVQDQAKLRDSKYLEQWFPSGGSHAPGILQCALSFYSEWQWPLFPHFYFWRLLNKIHIDIYDLWSLLKVEESESLPVFSKRLDRGYWCLEECSALATPGGFENDML